MLLNAQAGALAILAVLTASGDAWAETWCVRHFGDPPGYRFCAFGSAQECFRAVRVGGSGICEREPVAGTRMKPDARARARPRDPPRLTAW